MRERGGEVLRVEGLTKRYRSRRAVVEALADATFEVGAGEIVGLLGPNGAGKTTAIKSVCGLVTPTEGQICVAGVDAVAHRRLAARYVAAVLEGNRTVYWRLTVRENLEYFASLRGQHRRAVADRVEELIERFGLVDKASTVAMRLSRGMQQKLALACAVLPQAALLLLDEPTLGLDVETSHELRGYLRSLAEDGHAILLSSHDMDVVRDVCGHVVVINHGRVIANDRMQNLLQVLDTPTYKFRLGGPLSPDARKELERRFDLVELAVVGRGVELRVALGRSEQIYDLVNVLQNDHAPIESINSAEPDLEQAFLALLKEPA